MSILFHTPATNNKITTHNTWFIIEPSNKSNKRHEDLYTDNYNYNTYINVLKDTEEDLNKGEVFQDNAYECLRKMLIFPKLISRFNATPAKLSTGNLLSLIMVD